MKISKFINDPNAKPFHTSGYAEVAHGGSIGSTSSQSFQQRRRIDQNRQAIRRYRDSFVARGHDSNNRQSSEAGRFSALSTDSETIPMSQRHQQGAIHASTRPAMNQNLPPMTRPSFREPPARGFNPFS